MTEIVIRKHDLSSLRSRQTATRRQCCRACRREIRSVETLEQTEARLQHNREDRWVIGASVSEPHTCHVNAIFSVFLSVPYVLPNLNIHSRITKNSHVRKIATIAFTCSLMRRYKMNTAMDTSSVLEGTTAVGTSPNHFLRSPNDAPAAREERLRRRRERERAHRASEAAEQKEARCVEIPALWVPTKFM